MSPLFAPLALRSTTLPNRLVLPAMVTRLAGEDGTVNDAVRARYVRYARGGVGLIVVEAIAVHRAKSGPLLRIGEDAFMPGLADRARRGHAAGPGKVVPQLVHFLKVARSGWRQTIDSLDADAIDAVAGDHASAAERARTCGFDGVEIHMAHAYTLASFLSRLNPRRDGYGGTLDNRLRLPTEVVERVRRAVGPDFPVGVRLLGEECVRGGSTVVDAVAIAARLVRAGVDYVSLSVGGKFEDARHVPGRPLYPYTGYSGERCMPGSHYPDGANLPLALAVRTGLRARGLDASVVAVGKIGTKQLAEEVLGREMADQVGMARALLADPDIPRKWESGREDAVVRCVYGNVCKALDENFRRVRCTLWPKDSENAPESTDPIAPEWSLAGAALRARYDDGRVLLDWAAATDNEGVYGYQVLRGEGEGPLVHLGSTRAASTRFEDAGVAGGVTHRYAIRPYDLAGNLGPLSPEANVSVPHRRSLPMEVEASTLAQDDSP